MSIGKLLLAALILAVVLTAVIVFYRVRKKLRQVSRTVFGTDSLLDGWKKQERELAVTPKSVSGMTRILEPQIQRDFPEFNWVQFKNQAENMLLSAFSAVSSGDAALLGEASRQLKEQVSTQIQSNKQEGITECYRQVKIHQTELTRYEKKQGKCIVTLQSAVEHVHYKEREGTLLAGSKELPEQTKYNTELMYIQNAEEANMDHSLGVTCPHCGAPVTMLGKEKRCEYCGSPVIPVNIQVWRLQRYYEVDYHHV